MATMNMIEAINSAHRVMMARDPDVVVFGHSHVPWDESSEDPDDGLRLLNPGSPTDRRRQPHGTLGHLVLADGRVESWRLVEVS